MAKPIYLDYAAATPLDDQVLAVMKPYFSQQFYNPSAGYLAASAVRKELELARSKVAHWLGSRPSEIIFTAGGTEANNLAIHGIMSQYPQATVVTSAIEHDSVLAPAQNYQHRTVKVNADGLIDIADLEKQIDDQTVLVSIMYANNEVGSVQPVREVAALIARKRRERKSKLPLYLHTDACQASNYLDLHVARLGVDLLTLNGGKIYGPKQSGALYIKAGLQLHPLVDGGGQERGLRSGTENVAACIGFAAALEAVQTIRHQEVVRLQALQAEFFQLLETLIPDVIINGSRKSRLPNNVHATIPGQDNERLLILLDEVGILAAAGSACSASDEEPSHVLRAMGVDEADVRASLRFTMGQATTPAMVRQAVKALAAAIKK